jgi:hypothetical protein
MCFRLLKKGARKEQNLLELKDNGELVVKEKEK